MQKNKYILIAFFIGFSFMVFSCKKNYIEKIVYQPVPESGTLNLRLQTQINGANVILNSVKYLNAHMDTFKVSRLKYYISNIRLKSSTISYNIPESYYLIDASISNDTIVSIPNIPLGNYTEVELSIGVDSAHNHTGSQPGALDPTIADDMFWTWSAGYRFVLFEGTYKTASSGGFKSLIFHISDDVNYRSTTFNSGTSNWNNINIRDGKITEMNVLVNFEEMFKTPNTISFDLTNNVAGGPDANAIADNYADMLKLAGIVNQ